MKAKFNVKEIKAMVPTMTCEGIKMDSEAIFGGMEVEVEYTLAEMRGLWELQKEMLEESPDMVATFIDKVVANSLELCKRYNIEEAFQVREVRTEKVKDME